jgi:hypothetical protein
MICDLRDEGPPGPEFAFLRRWLTDYLHPRYCTGPIEERTVTFSKVTSGNLLRRAFSALVLYPSPLLEYSASRDVEEYVLLPSTRQL